MPVNGATLTTVASLFSTINSFFKVNLPEFPLELDDIVIVGPTVSLVIGLKPAIVIHPIDDMVCQGTGGISIYPAVVVLHVICVKGFDHHGATVNATSMFVYKATSIKRTTSAVAVGFHEKK